MGLLDRLKKIFKKEERPGLSVQEKQFRKEFLAGTIAGLQKRALKEIGRKFTSEEIEKFLKEAEAEEDRRLAKFERLGAITEHLLKGISEPVKRVRKERERLKKQREEVLKKHLESKQFFERQIKEAGYTKYGRLKEVKESKEKFKKILPPSGFKITEKSAPSQRSKILSKLIRIFKGEISQEEEIRLEKQKALQELARKLTYQLAKWWGIPRNKVLVPKIQIVGKEQEKTGKKVEIASLVSQLGQPRKIQINEEYLSEEFQSGIFNIKSAIAEEVCHALEEVVKRYEFVMDEKYVAEFFGLISRFYISEQVPKLFHIEYERFLREAAIFTIEKRRYDKLIKEIKEQRRKLYYDKFKRKQPQHLIEKLIEKIEKLEEEAKDKRDHLSYYPAAAYYYEIREMKPEQRYELLKMEPSEIKETIIQRKAVKKLREKLRIQREKELKQYPEPKKFFQKTAKEAGYKEWGRLEHPIMKEITEKVLKTRIPTTKLEKTAEKIAEQAAVGAVTKTVTAKVPAIHAVKTVSKVSTVATSLLPEEEHEQFEKEEERELRRAQQKLTKEHKEFQKEEEKLLEKAEQKLTEEEKQFQKEEEEELGKASGG